MIFSLADSSGSAGGGATRRTSGAGWMANAAAVTVAVALLLLLSVSVTPAAAAAAATSPQFKTHGVRLVQKRLMDCSERCESPDIKIFKAYWQRNYSDRHFIDFLRDIVVYSAFFPELKDFKPVVDNIIQNYEICRYVTCSTDYLG